MFCKDLLYGNYIIEIMTSYCPVDPTFKEIHEVWEELMVIFEEAECYNGEGRTFTGAASAATA